MEKREKKSLPRLSMEVPQVIHDNIKLMTIHHHCSITAWVLRAIANQLKHEEQYK